MVSTFGSKAIDTGQYYRGGPDRLTSLASNSNIPENALLKGAVRATKDIVVEDEQNENLSF
jgi:hypothetical protein